jgi:hypothetical protein
LIPRAAPEAGPACRKPLFSRRRLPHAPSFSRETIRSPPSKPTLAGLIGGSVNLKRIRAHWDDILRLGASIRQGTVAASLMLRKLGSYPRQNGLAVALRELGRIERTLFALDWMQNVDLRRRVQVGLNKGEARNTLARAVFLNRLGEVRDRCFENQRYRAGGLNLVVAAITLWNAVYLERAIQALRASGTDIDEALLPIDQVFEIRWLVNSTIADNSANWGGSGFVAQKIGDFDLEITFFNSLLGGNSAPPGTESCSNDDVGYGLATFTSQGNNLEDFDLCNFHLAINEKAWAKGAKMLKFWHGHHYLRHP